MALTIIRSDKHNTTITFVSESHEGKPLTRIWQGQGRTGGTEISLSGSTQEGMQQELNALLDPQGHHAQAVKAAGGKHDDSWRQVFPPLS